MKSLRQKVCLLICAVAVFIPFQKGWAAKSSGNFGAGIILGSPTALTGKYWLDSKSAIDFGLAFGYRNYVLIYGDYLAHFHGLFGHQTKFISQLDPYLGLGGILVSGSYDPYYDGDYDYYYGRYRRGSVFGLGLRIPFGVEWRPGNPPIGVFVEIAPGISIVPATYSWFQAGVGIRYYF